MEFDAIFTVKKEFSKDTFLRELIIELGTANNTPIDIVDAEFSEVRESIREVIVCTAKIEGTCTASVGYDRQEPYTDYESYREKVGDSYVTRQRAVTKYRTITDWKVYQAPYSGKAVRAAYNSDKYGSDDSSIVTAIKTCREDSTIEKGTATVNTSGLTEALASCMTAVELDVKFPGDRHKDANFNSDYEIEALSCYKLPYYEVTYVYNNEEYTASCFACGDINIYASTPENDIDITAVVEEKTENLQKTQKLTWTLFTISLILAFVLCFALKFGWLFPIPLILLLKAKKDSDFYKNEYEKLSDDLSRNIADSKVAAIRTALEKHGFEPLSKDVSDSLEGTSVPGAKKLKPIKTRVIWSWILTILLTIISIFNINNAHQKSIHSAKHIKVDVISKNVEYDPDASGYIYGCYYIYFDYEIQSKKVGVDYIELVAHVSDKKGNELGDITTTLSDINADAGDKKVITTSLKENQPEKDEFFTLLYNTDFSELEFDFEIISVHFSDGKSIYDGEYSRF